MGTCHVVALFLIDEKDALPKTEHS